MNTSDEEIRDAIAEQAAEWLVANQSGALDDLGRKNFLAWLRSSPIHVAEYLSVAGLDRDLTSAAAELDQSVQQLVAGALQEEVEAAPKTTVGALSRRIWPAWPGMTFRVAFAAILFAMAAAGAVWMMKDGFRRSEDYSTAHGVQRLLHLSDGSDVHLDTDSAVTVRFSRLERLVELSRGQAYFRVARDPRRFRVTVAGASVIAVGTEFDVDQRGQSTSIALVEGQLAVVPAGVDIPKPGVPLTDAKILNKGEQARINPGGIVLSGAAASMAEVTAWLEHQIVVDDRSLEDVAAQFNRYGRVPIEITDVEVRQLHISGTFNAYDTDSFLAFLEQMDGLTVARGPEVIQVTRRSRSGRGG